VHAERRNGLVHRTAAIEMRVSVDCRGHYR
jgi:hypothetical protein